MTARPLAPLPRHIRKLRRIRRSAWLAILLSLAFRGAFTAFDPVNASSPTPAVDSEQRP